MEKENKQIKKAETRDLVISRLIDAPREMVFKAWTDPAQMSKWWGPKDFTTPVCEMDLKAGGKWFFCMRSPEGQNFWCTGVFREITEPEKIVMTDHFADENGNVVPASHYGMSPDWPMEMIITVTFEEIDNKTKLTITQSNVLSSGTDRDGSIQGWTESLERLDNLVTGRK